MSTPLAEGRSAMFMPTKLATNFATSEAFRSLSRAAPPTRYERGSRARN